MNPTALLLATFILSVVGLFTFIWSLRKGLFDTRVSAARVIFSPGEFGMTEEPAADARGRDALQQHSNAGALHGQSAVSSEELAARRLADQSSSSPALVLLSCAVVWLLVASAAGMVSSLKLHMPDLLTDCARFI
jgi:cytochrome c oxidase cbb3-type subunit 1